MAQNYRTTRPTFIQDIMYQPPWELAKEVILEENNKVKSELDKATALGQTLNFNTLDFDRGKADEKRNYYTSKINDITSKINKDPMNYNKYSLDIADLQKEMLSDFTTGEIGAMTGDYNSYQTWLKDNTDVRKKSSGRFNAANKAFLNEVRKSRQTNGYTRAWNGEQVLEEIDFRDGFLKHLKQAKPNIQAYANSGVKGGFIFKEKGKTESLSPEEVQQLMYDYISTTPNINEYVAQSNRIGLPMDVQGLLDYSKNFAYSNKTVDESSLTRDPMSMIGAREASQMRLANYKNKLAKDLASYKAGLKGDQEIYNGEVHTSTARGLLGDVMLRNLEQSLGQEVGKTINRNNAVTYGLPSIISQGIVTEKQAKDVQSRIDKFVTPSDFGNKQIVFVPNKSITVSKNGRKTSLQNGQSYIMTIKQAQNIGLLDSKQPIVENSGKPFYFTDKYNGVQFNFRTENKDIISGNLMPTGSHTAIKEGLQIFQKE